MKMFCVCLESPSELKWFLFASGFKLNELICSNLRAAHYLKTELEAPSCESICYCSVLIQFDMSICLSFDLLHIPAFLLHIQKNLLQKNCGKIRARKTAKNDAITTIFHL